MSQVMFCSISTLMTQLIVVWSSGRQCLCTVLKMSVLQKKGWIGVTACDASFYFPMFRKLKRDWAHSQMKDHTHVTCNHLFNMIIL